jgi:uncharacterized ferritin-like protein (DUF455 family)
MSEAHSLYQAARACLLCDSVDQKLAMTEQVARAWEKGELLLSGWTPADHITLAGHPERPELVSPNHLPRRRLGSEEGRLAMIHAITHIEFNAINLAWDAVQRFPDLPPYFYNDWIQVAREEVEHFCLLRKRLQAGGIDYGDFPGHNGLWEMAMRTAKDPLVRMALVPRMLEARGLDVTPGIMQRFQSINDHQTVQALEVILREEVGHVKFGSHWFSYLCLQRGLDPEETYFDLIQSYLSGEIHCPLHHQARLDAGFSQKELQRLEVLCKQHES